MLSKEKKDFIENITSLLAVLILIFIAFKIFGIENIQNKVATAGIWAPIIFILAKASTIVFAPISGSPLYPLAGALFGFWPGFLFLVIGDALGSTISFLISRFFGRNLVEKFLRNNSVFLDKILYFLETTSGFVLARICFAALPEVVSYSAGLTRIRFLKFFSLHNLIGLIPTAILVFSGVLLTSQKFDEQMFVFLLVLGTLVAILGGIVFLKIVKHLPTRSDFSENKKADEKFKKN